MAPGKDVFLDQPGQVLRLRPGADPWAPDEPSDVVISVRQRAFPTAAPRLANRNDSNAYGDVHYKLMR